MKDKLARIGHVWKSVIHSLQLHIHHHRQRMLEGIIRSSASQTKLTMNNHRVLTAVFVLNCFDAIGVVAI